MANARQQPLPVKGGAPFTPHQAYASQPTNTASNYVTNLIDKRPLSKENTS